MAGTWTTIDKPGAGYTCIYGIDSSNIVGHYDDGTLNGFLYNRTTQNWTTITNSLEGTWVTSIDGGNLVGYYDVGGTKGFLYNGKDWTSINGPQAQATWVNGINGNNLVGTYQVADQYGSPNPPESHGFVYNITTQILTPLDKPGASNTWINGIEGGNLVGEYFTASGEGHGFLYNGANWITLDMPGAYQTCIRGISGNYLVGFYDASGRHSFLYNKTTQIWTNINKPGATLTEVWGIDGSNVVGQYYDATGSHGFIYTIPEPATLLLLGLGGLAILKKRRK
jgi:hypothetical protein